MTTHETFASKVDQLFAEWDRSDSPGAALTVIRDGEIIYKQGYGMANLEYDIPITTTTTFELASTSKQFTAFAIAMLLHKGKLSLDDDIQKYLPDVPDFGSTIFFQRFILRETVPDASRGLGSQETELETYTLRKRRIRWNRFLEESDM
ncbi:hypothetical protein C6503_15410 [Candidatus Poribacteria bacterium]|nr:MAG: hypothetical protein C6503_15410 [Candidatus Poribacteria bacterium]